MFGTNEIVGKSYFKDAGTNLYVTSCFWTIQGEGPYMGKPAFFIRMAKCNFICSMCDSYFDSGTWFETDALIDKMIDLSLLVGDDGQAPSYIAQGDFIIVLTGGEPMLQSSALSVFVDRLKHILPQWRNTIVQMETNGVFYDKELYNRIDVVVSPKVSEKIQRYIKPSKQVLDECVALKFVISADENSPYHTIPEWADEYRHKTFVSPMNMYSAQPIKTKDDDIDKRSTIDEVISFWTPGLLDMTANQANHEYAARLAMMEGYRMQVQMHLLCSLA